MRINRENITQFISYLFWKRKGEAPSRDLLESWEILDDEAIQEHLQVLFHNWGYDEVAQQKEIGAFFIAENNEDRKSVV